MTRISKAQARALGINVPGPNKYGARKVTVDGITFDSKKEARKYQELKLLKRAGEIKDFELQPEFVLLEGFQDLNGTWHRPIKYRADFRVTYPDGRVVVIDTKGYRTKDYAIKKKMFLYQYPDIEFMEE